MDRYIEGQIQYRVALCATNKVWLKIKVFWPKQGNVSSMSSKIGFGETLLHCRLSCSCCTASHGHSVVYLHQNLDCGKPVRAAIFSENSLAQTSNSSSASWSVFRHTPTFIFFNKLAQERKPYKAGYQSFLVAHQIYRPSCLLISCTQRNSILNNVSIFYLSVFVTQFYICCRLCLNNNWVGYLPVLDGIGDKLMH